MTATHEDFENVSTVVEVSGTTAALVETPEVSVTEPASGTVLASEMAPASEMGAATGTEVSETIDETCTETPTASEAAIIDEVDESIEEAALEVCLDTILQFIGKVRAEQVRHQ